MTRLLLLLALVVPGLAQAAPQMVRVPAGSYRPFFRDLAPKPATPAQDRIAEEKPAQGVRGEEREFAAAPLVQVPAFRLDVRPVTNREFLLFVQAHPQWRRSQAPRLFVDTGYLSAWEGDLALGPRSPAEAPVTAVSWFAARAYCRAQDKRLPTVDEWERAASEEPEAARATAQRVLAWYSQPNDALPAPVGQGPKNRYGVQDLHALVWEWTLDFNNSMTGDESRKAQGADASLFCGSGGARATDPSDYVSFMRYAFRSSLKARYTVRNLGFRCARDGEL